MLNRGVKVNDLRSKIRFSYTLSLQASPASLSIPEVMIIEAAEGNALPIYLFPEDEEVEVVVVLR